jgi:hypothetical protein
MERINQHQCSGEDGCGHYTWSHGKHGCVAIVNGKDGEPACCPCLKTFPDAQYGLMPQNMRGNEVVR